MCVDVFLFLVCTSQFFFWIQKGPPVVRFFAEALGDLFTLPVYDLRRPLPTWDDDCWCGALGARCAAGGRFNFRCLREVDLVRILA